MSLKHVLTCTNETSYIAIRLITFPYPNFELGGVQAFDVRLQVAIEDVGKDRLEHHFRGGHSFLCVHVTTTHVGGGPRHRCKQNGLPSYI